MHGPAPRSDSPMSEEQDETRPMLPTLESGDSWDDESDAPTDPDAAEIGAIRWNRDAPRFQRQEDAPKRRKHSSSAPAHKDGKTIFEVAWSIAASTMHATPLLLPHAFALTGLPLGIATLFFLAALSCLSNVVLVVQGRYVGARTYAQLAAAVVPAQGPAKWLASAFIDLLTAFVSGGKTVILVMLSADLLSDLARFYFPKTSLHAFRPIAITAITASNLLPTFFFPRSKSLLTSKSYPTLNRVPIFSISLYLVALVILGVASKNLTWHEMPKLVDSIRSAWKAPKHPGMAEDSNEIMGLSIWAGISIFVLALTPQPATFALHRSLRQTRTLFNSQSEDPNTLLHLSAGQKAKRPFRYGWELAAFFGMFFSAMISLGWGLVGYLSIKTGVVNPNLFTSLPLQHRWLIFARILLLCAFIPNVPATALPAQNSIVHILRNTGKHLGIRSCIYSDDQEMSSSEECQNTNSEGQPDDTPALSNRGKGWDVAFSALILWIIVSFTAILATWADLRHSGSALASIAEITGCIGCTLLAFLIPALFFIIIFHVRKPRNIFMSDTRSSEWTHDAALQRKEKQLQKKLSGRRIWMDILVFGGLLPFGLVIFVRGCVSIARRGV